MAVFGNQTKKPPNVIVFERESDIFRQEAFTQIHNASKLRTLAVLKTDIGTEKHYRTCITKQVQAI